MAHAKRFKSPIPKGLRIYESEIQVAGIKHRFEHAAIFARRKNQYLILQPDPGNTHDRNAIKVIGHSKGWFLEADIFIGYVPAGVAKKIAKSGLADKLKARLKRIFVGDKEYIEILFDIVGPKDEFDKY